MNHHINELLNNAPCGFLSFTDDGTIVMVNATLSALLGYENDELNRRKIETILPIASKIFYQTHFFPMLKMQGKVEEIYFSLRSKQGNNIPILVNAIRHHHLDSFITHCIFVAIHQRIKYEDEILKAKKAAEEAIRSQREAENALRQEYERSLLVQKITQQIHESMDLQEIFKNASAGIYQCLQADRVGIFKFINNSNFHSGEFIFETLNSQFDSAMGTIIHDHCFGEKYAISYQKGRIQSISDIYQANLSECYRHILTEFQIRANLIVPLVKLGNLWGLLCVHQCSKAREWKDFEIDFVQQIANQLAIAIHQVDLFNKLQEELIERKQAEAKLKQTNQELAHTTLLLEKLVNTDGLTKIANRRCFDHRLEYEWERLYREAESLSLILFDVDYFKRYNDYYGHQMGDDCLIKLAQATQSAVSRSTDLVARYGGEEFVIILPKTDLQGAITVATKIHASIKNLAIPHQASEVSDIVTISLGISTLIPNPYSSIVDFIEQADKALYTAKQQGRNQSVVFSGK
ncbi:diguanylate cyclase [Okeanomitos corallinicola TIOX110]|uniref:Diguanylate cyclase n=1 Tax=Okeanomitos corallinicola TIOX110 TaxID=3133117 RepID=A0ABZ2UU15_9CYAN